MLVTAMESQYQSITIMLLCFKGDTMLVTAMESQYQSITIMLPCFKGDTMLVTAMESQYQSITFPNDRDFITQLISVYELSSTCI